MTDLRKAECPYCRKALKKIPGSKTKCPHCGELMFVRTRPKDRARLVVTKEEADKFQDDWELVVGIDVFMQYEEEILKAKKDYEAIHGHSIPDKDILWGLLNSKLNEHAQQSNWGLYRNVRLDMAEVLRSEMKLESALEIYLEVCFYDLNGPVNLDGNTGGFFNRRKGFDPENDAFLASSMLECINLIMKHVNYSKEKVKEIFINHNSRIERNLKLPVSVSKCWDKIAKLL